MRVVSLQWRSVCNTEKDNGRHSIVVNMILEHQALNEADLNLF